MTGHPTGTVTFLFTDIEGSTKLAQQYPEAIPALLARHNDILNQAIDTHNGYVFQVVGDSFAASFHNANDALNAALQAQRFLHNENWNPAPIKVRMGIHTGTAQLQIDSKENKYSGYATIALAQRIMSAGHGGQILLSQTTYDLIRDQLPENALLMDMGERSLKDIFRLEHLYQFNTPDLPSEFPALKTLDMKLNNLPAQMTSFIGRKKEVEQIKKRLEKNRLVMLTGSGGIGKTRLSIQVAYELLGDYHVGVWLVELAPLTDPMLVPQGFCAALGVKPEGSTPALDALINYLRSKKILLVVDNCEHLIDACAQLCDSLLQACPELRIIASSREALGIEGESAYRVPSLSLPDSKSGLHTIVESESVKLFVERAGAVLPEFEITEINAPVIAQICQRLDGIALAIELAASRVKMLKVEQIAARLDDAFRLLTGGSRTALPRQQTLRALIDWSYNLLSDEERILLRRLSVFVGGWTLEAAEAVCGNSDMLDLLTHLADKSLVAVDLEHGDEPRYYLLETVRQYTREKLFEARESETLRQRHLEYYLSLAEQPLEQSIGVIQSEWLPHMVTEHDNLRAALGWCLDSGDIQTGLRLAVRLGSLWLDSGYMREGKDWLELFIARTPQPTLERASGLHKLGIIIYNMGDYASALPLLEESLALFDALGDPSGIATITFQLAWLHFALGNYAQSRHLLERSLKLFQDLNKPEEVAYVILWMGDLANAEGDFVRARELLEQSTALHRHLEDKIRLSYAIIDLGCVLIHFGELDRSETLLKESLTITAFLGHIVNNYLELLGFAFLANARSQPLRAVRLLGAWESQCKISGYHIEGPERPDYESNLASLRSQLSEAEFDKAWNEGFAMDYKQAIAFALEETQ